MRSTYLPVSASFLFSITMIGCGPADTRLYPVSGRVSLEDSVIEVGTVSLYPDAAGANFVSTGTISSDGTYSITTDGKPGAPLGTYRVAITPQAPTGVANSRFVARSLIPIRYGNPTDSKIVIDVVAVPATGAYDFKLIP